MKAKWLKSRDSGAVGKYITFQLDWSTLTFNPVENPDAQGHSNNATINIKAAPTVITENGKETMAPSKKGTSVKVSGSTLRGKSGKKSFKGTNSAAKSTDTDTDEERSPKQPAILLPLGNALKTSNKNPKLF